MKIVVTGASGLLGRAVVKAANAKGWTVVGLAFSRARHGLEKVDITNASQVRAVLEREQPDFVIHAAAERMPDRVENEYEKTRDLNVDASESITLIAKSVGSRVIYISTDYVFDGANPPYTADDTPQPLNKYGITKLDGENAVRNADPESLVLRVPILYGPVERLDESAVTCLLRLVQATATPASVSHYEKRYPEHVSAISDILCQLCEKVKQEPSISGIFQWSGLEQFTKYDMCVSMAEALGLSHSHITADSQPSSGAPRPYDSRMDNSKLEQLGVTSHVTFKDGIKQCLQKWL
uniref:Methionine adenosyltransferase 2 subunit beta n=1 Tax=Hirondellea gigas TaxID=1518452 RepID=A0A2P2I315_9CRUS